MRNGRRGVGLVAASLAFVCCSNDRPPGYYGAPDVVDSAVEPAVPPRPAAQRPDAGDITRLEVMATTPPAAPPDSVPSFVGLVRRLSPSVVNIYTRETVERGANERVLAPWPTDRSDEPETSLGSGLVVDGDGLILTNAHVVENAAEIRVRLVDGNEFQAGLVGFDPIRDLALLKIDGADGLVPVERGDSDKVAVGQWVIAIGNPMGLSHTVTKGIVSARGRSELVSERVGYVDLIQIDAAVNRGSSGGPLFDMDGRVIGMTTAIAAESWGIAFAIAWNTIEDALPRLAQGGYVSRSWLGVYIGDGGAGAARLPVDAVVKDSPAARAGVRPGDIIVAMDGRAVQNATEFRLRVATATAGREVRLLLERLGVLMDLAVTPEEARDLR